LRRYVEVGAPKLEFSLPNSLSGPLLDDVKWRTDRIEGGIMAFLRFMGELQREAVKPQIWPKSGGQQRLQEQLFEVTGAFPPGSRENPENQLATTLMRVLRGELETLPPKPTQ
jgi:hypothetical protein